MQVANRLWIRFCCEPMHNVAFGLDGCPAQGTYMTSCCVRAGRCMVKHPVHVIVAFRIIFMNSTSVLARLTSGRSPTSNLQHTRKPTHLRAGERVISRFPTTSTAGIATNNPGLHAKRYRSSLLEETDNLISCLIRACICIESIRNSSKNQST